MNILAKIGTTILLMLLALPLVLGPSVATGSSSQQFGLETSRAAEVRVLPEVLPCTRDTYPDANWYVMAERLRIVTDDVGTLLEDDGDTVAFTFVSGELQIEVTTVFYRYDEYDSPSLLCSVTSWESLYMISLRE